MGSWWPCCPGQRSERDTVHLMGSLAPDLEGRWRGIKWSQMSLVEVEVFEGEGCDAIPAKQSFGKSVFACLTCDAWTYHGGRFATIKSRKGWTCRAIVEACRQEASVEKGNTDE